MLTELMEKAARVIAANPSLTKTAIARRLGCSRRSVTGWMGREAFVARVRELQGSESVDIAEMVDGLTAPEIKELIRNLRGELGERIPEIEEIERLVREERLNTEITTHTVSLLREVITSDDAIVTVSREDVERMEAVLDARIPDWRKELKSVQSRRCGNGASVYCTGIDDIDGWCP